MRTKIIIIGSILIFFWITAHAQNPEWINYHHDNWISRMAQEGDYLWVASRLGLYKINRMTGEKELFNSAAGAPGIMLTAIAIDHDGNKWVGSMDGLAKFDNVTWTYFHQGNSPLPYNWISALFVDQQNRLWIGTAQGLAILNNDEWQFPGYGGSEISKAWIWDIEAGASGKIWFAANGGMYQQWTIPKVVKVFGAEWETTTCPVKDSLYFIIMDICPAKNGDVWVATWGNLGGYLAYLHSDRWNFIEDKIRFPYAHAVAEDLTGNIWASNGTWVSSVVARFDGSSWLYFDRVNSPLQARVNAIFTDSDGYLWIGDCDPGSGLLRFDGQSWLVVPLATSPEYMNASVIDQNNVAWCRNVDFVDGKYLHGLKSFDSQEWRKYFSPEVSNSSLDDVVTIDANNNLWMAMALDSGYKLARFDRTSWLTSPVIACDYVFDLSVRDNQQILLFSERSFMEYDFDNKKTDQIVEYPIEVSGGIALDHKIFADDGKNIWIGTRDGLLRYNKDGWVVYDTTNSQLPDNNVSCLALKDATGIWIATFGGGLSFYDGTHWITYPELTPLNTTGYCMLVDHSDNLWIGASNCGLIKFDSIKFTTYKPLNSGLSENSIRYLAMDGFGNLWITLLNSGVDIFREGGIVGNFIRYSKAPYFVAASHIPLVEQLFHAYPNPFNRVMTLRIDLPEPQFVRATIYDLLGREVEVLINDQKTAGSHYAKFKGQGLATGIYFIRVEIGAKSSTQKILFIK